MPLHQVDLIVRDRMVATLNLVQENTSLLDDVFGGRPVEEIVEIRDYFAGPLTPVKLGYPLDPGELPGIFVILAAGREEAQEGAIGMAFQDIGTPIGFDEYRGVWLRDQLRLMCWSQNPNLTVWLQNLALWALLLDRDELSEAGLEEQQVSVGDFEPLPQWFPDRAYRRDVVLTAKHAATFLTRYPKVEDVKTTVTSS